MSWASKRKSTIVVLIFGILCLLGGFFTIPFLTHKPTCFDSKKNGDEAGIDCGGGCALQCKEFTQDVAIHWQRSYQIVPGFYNAVAYIQNQNFQSGVKEVPYKFSLFDKDRLLIAVREGVTFIEPNKGMVVFEQQIPVGERTPVYTTFSFSETPNWYKTDVRFNDLVVQVSNQQLVTDDIKPRFSAVLKNVSEKYTISDIDVYVLLYDQDDNVVQVGKTVVSEIGPRKEQNIFTVWQNAFPIKPVRYEVISRYNPFTQVFSDR